MWFSIYTRHARVDDSKGYHHYTKDLDKARYTALLVCVIVVSATLYSSYFILHKWSRHTPVYAYAPHHIPSRQRYTNSFSYVISNLIPESLQDFLLYEQSRLQSVPAVKGNISRKLWLIIIPIITLHWTRHSYMHCHCQHCNGLQHSPTLLPASRVPYFVLVWHHILYKLIWLVLVPKKLLGILIAYYFITYPSVV